MHRIYRDSGFPAAEFVSVRRRENTGAGRYVDLESAAELRVSDGYLDLGGSYIEMEGVSNGIMAVALVQSGRLTLLEFSVYGGESWDGDEREWRII